MTNHKDFLLNARKIAVVRTDRIGDMKLTLPMSAKRWGPMNNKNITLSQVI